MYPNSDNATKEVQRIANASEYSPYITGRYTADAIDSDLYREDGAGEFGRTRGMGEHAIVLKLSTNVKSPQLGFAFGRNGARCDICFHNDPLRRLSNIHFRIYVNKFGVVLLEDQSTNGTIVDDVLLKKRAKDNGAVRRVLESGSTIKVFMHENAEDLVFLVRIPRRDGELEAAYERNLQAHLRRLRRVEDPDRTIQPGDGVSVGCTWAATSLANTIHRLISCRHHTRSTRQSQCSTSQPQAARRALCRVNGAVVRSTIVSAPLGKAHLPRCTR